MIKHLLTLSLFGILLAHSGCKPTKSQSTEAPPANKEMAAPTEEVQTNAECKTIVKNEAMPKSDLIDRMEATVNGDCLDLNLTFGGGCNEHIFNLYWDGSFMKSFPPQVNLRLFHDKKGDACKAIVEQKVSFDLKTIQNGGEVIINLSAEGAQALKLTYK